MSKIASFYGTQMSSNSIAAEAIQKEFGSESIIALYDISKTELSDFDDYSYMILSSPIFHIGELQSDWEDFYDDLDSINFKSKKIAYFEIGDRVSYPSTFPKVRGIMKEKISELGGKTVSYWSNNSYELADSKTVRDRNFVGLTLDEDNQFESKQQRLKSWVAQLKQKFAL